jgi:hypothetical protein
MTVNSSHKTRAHKKLEARLRDAQATIHALERRMVQIERASLAVLSSGLLTKPQQEEFVGLLAGSRSGKGLDPALANYTAAEQHLVACHRAIDTDNKQTLTRIAKQLAELAQLRAKKGGR